MPHDPHEIVTHVFTYNEITIKRNYIQSILFPLKKIAHYLDCPISTVFLTVKNSSQIILFILLLLMNIPLRMLDNGSPIGWCRPTEQTVTKYRQQQR